MGDPKSITQTPSFGTISEQIALALPPGRRNLLPRLTFTYVSSGGLDIAGLGWQLEAGHIDRSTRNGVPTFTDADLFNLSIGGGSSDLAVVGTGTYRAKFESQYRLAVKTADSWQVREAQGTLYKFGSSAASKVTDATGTRTAAWMLDLIQDSNGNTIQFKYLRDHGVLYLSEIDYTGYAPTSDPGYYKVLFEYEARPDQRRSFARAMEEDRFLRLHRVSIFAGSVVVRRYVVNYDVSPTNGRSLVASLVLVGDDDASSITARTFQYQTRAVGWPTTSVASLPRSLNASDGHDLGVRLVDVNGDNFVDLIDNGNAVFLGDGTGGFASNPTWSTSIAAIGVPVVHQEGNNPGIDNGVRILDVNGDGRADVLVANLNTLGVFLNNGTGWTLDSGYSTSLNNIHEVVPVSGGGTDNVPFSITGQDSDSLGVQFGDVNGDSLTDIVWSFQITSGLSGTSPLDTDAGIAAREPQTIAAVYLNTGTGFVRDDARSASLAAAVPDSFVKNTEVQGFDLLDVNGDGLADIVRTLDGTDRVVLINTGSGWSSDPDFTASLTAATNIVSLSSDRKSLGLLPMDFNNDGLLDYVRSDSTVTVAYRNTGLGWTVDSAMTSALTTLGLKLVDSSSAPTGVVTADVNGDGIADLVQARDGGTNAIRLATGLFPDLLAHAVSALGEITSISYGPSSAYDNTGGDAIQDLPTVLQVATSLTRDDGRGNQFQSLFSYAGGLQLDRKLRGFATGMVVDSRNVTQLLHFFQDEARLGQISSGQTLDTLSRVRSNKTSTYQLATPVAGVTQAQLVQLDEEVIDPADISHPAGSLHTRTRTIYDQFLNVIEVDKDGDITVTGDEGRTVMQHVSNLALNIVDPISRISTYDAAGKLVSQTITYYDGLPEGQVAAGNPTLQVESVVIGGATISRPTCFDKYGNVLKVGDGANHFTSFEYDPTTNTYRTKLIDPNGRTIQSSYDLRFGIATSEVDFDGHTQTRALDAFGRLVRETLPGDEASPLGTQTITYSPLGDASNQNIRIDSTTTAGQPDSFATTTFYDGFAQAYLIEAPAEGGQVVLQTTDFDDAGNAQAVSRPFFATETPAITTYTRDALRRLSTVTEPDGISHTITSYGSTSDVVDRRGNLARFIRDAYGKVTEEHQFVAGVDHVTRYQFDSVGNPTTITDALGEVTNFTYDALGRRTSITDPSAGKFSYSYDSAGNLASQVDSDGKTTTFTYDSARQLLRKTLPDGRVIRFEYDLAKSTNTIGRVAKIYDDVGLLEVEYDVRGNVAIHRRHIDDQVYITGYGHDSMGRLRRVVYPDGYAVNYTYNAAGYVEKITDSKSDAIVANVDYNAAGAITNIQMDNGTNTQRTYDLLSRLNRLTTKNGVGTLIQDRQHGYDPVGNVTSITDFAFGRSQSFTYDEKNRITSAVGAYGSENYQYDAIGNLLMKGSILMGYDSTRQQQVTCGIDLAAARLIHSASGPSPRNSDDDKQFGVCIGLLKKRTLSSADRSALNAFAGVAYPSTFESDTTFVATHDKRGNMTEKNDTNYVYDSENHLLRVEHDGCVLEENVYDAGGNRVLRKTNPGGKDAQVTVLIEGIFEMNGSDAYRHVTDGHMLVASVRSAASSVHLVSSVDPTAFALLTAPSAREGVSHFGGTPLRSSVPFVGLALFGVALAGSRSARARRLWREARGVGRGVASQARRRPARWLVALFLVPTYLTYAGNVRADLAVATASAVAPLEYFFYHVDHVGNVEAISNHNGQVVQRLQYKPFGEQFSDHIAPTHSGFLDASDPHAKALDRSFNGHEFDAASSLYYFGARHYNPILGRFLSADTKVFEGENPQLLHRYAFNVNNPIRYADLTGHGFWDVVLGIVVAVLIIAAVVVVSIGTAGVGDIVFGVAVGVLIGAGVGLAVGAVLAYAKYGNLTSAASLRLILATTFAGELVGASVGFIVGAGGLGAAFSAQNIADWAGHDLIANLLIGAAGGAIGAEAGADPNNPDYGLEIFLGTAIGAGVGAIAGASDGLGNIWEPINFPGWEAGLFSLYGGATGSFLTVNGYICKQTGVACFQDPGITPSTDISSSSSQLTVERRRGVPAWSFDGTSLGSGTVSFINREHLDLYPLAP